MLVQRPTFHPCWGSVTFCCRDAGWAFRLLGTSVLCQAKGVKRGALLTRILSLLAIFGLLAAPLAPRMAMANQVAEAAMAMADMEEGMPCCPDQKSSTSDCQKSCPLAVMCMAKCFPNAADWGGHGDMVESLAGVIAPVEELEPHLLAAGPPSEPPRT